MANGVNVLNVIRQNATAVYQDRIPEATAENLHEVGDAILTYEAQANEFVNALVNRIGLVILNNRMATNPLAALKKGRLAVGETAYISFFGRRKNDEDYMQILIPFSRIEWFEIE